MVTTVAPPNAPALEETRPGWLIAGGAAAAVLAAAVVMAVISAVTIVLWAAGPQDSAGGVWAPLGVAAQLWVLAHRVSIDTAAGAILLPPLLITFAQALVTARTAGWVVRSTRAHERAGAATVVAAVALTHGVLVALAAGMSEAAGVFTSLRAGVVAGLIFAVIGAAPQTWTWARARARHGPLVRCWARGLGAGLVGMLGGGMVVVAVALVVDLGTARDLVESVGGGFAGVAAMVALSLALLPNAALWAVAFATGSSVAVGNDAALGLHGMDPGALPALPLLAALPAPGELAPAALLALLVGPIAGMAIGWFGYPTAVGGVRYRLRVAVPVAAAFACALALGALAWIGDVNAGGRLSDLGPSAQQVTVRAAFVLVPSAALMALGRALWTWWRRPKRPAVQKSAGVDDVRGAAQRAAGVGAGGDAVTEVGDVVAGGDPGGPGAEQHAEQQSNDAETETGGGGRAVAGEPVLGPKASPTAEDDGPHAGDDAEREEHEGDAGADQGDDTQH
ncbi:MAG: cell division protein PerM [Sporichthyaceae bacterium]